MGEATENLEKALHPLPYDEAFIAPLTSTHPSESSYLDPDIKRLVCARCWETVFSIESFHNMWERSVEGIELGENSMPSQDLYNSSLTYRTPPWGEILKSADAFCGYCTWIRNTRRVALPEEPPTHEVLIVTVLFDLLSAVQRMKITFWTDTKSLSSLSPYNTGIYAEPEDPASRYITARNVVWKVDHSTSYELSLKCINACSRHERCPRPVPTILPTRVLDCNDPLRLRLVATHAFKKDFFAALSYVWGGPQLHCTTTENINGYYSFIEPAKIPKTISDAVIVTRRLGLRYLWVDSFCIIQDSDDDKAHEISKMRLTFRDAFITILAARANAVSEGFLQNVFPSLHFAPIRLPFRCPDGTIGTITVVRHAQLPEAVDSRAWCLEERVLSPRILVFSTLGLQYECQTARVNVNGSALGLPPTIARLPDYVFAAEPSDNAEWELNISWDLILQQYTASNLTNQEDKLLALAGVAEQVHRFWPQSRYIAGLWTHRLPQALLWEQQSHKVRPKAYRAPSWSWASVDGQIMPGEISGRSDAWHAASKRPRDSVVICEVKSVVVNLKHAGSPYGEVTSACLVLCADLVRATWNTQEDSVPRVLVPDDKTGHGLLVAGRRGLENSVGLVGLDAVELPEDSVAEITLAGVLKNGVPLPFITRLGQYDIRGLILLPAHKQGEGGVTIYRRIGEFIMNAENWSPICKQDIQIV
ncbi:heterokaryon incompatibility protein-domain-containing protein [Collybia nuda]|uniref:Heterokaryon incompatibility protein-domain-containing protein n=1 Tax=Collybia nuda TaxID=64659 RepID=A0A9P6CDE3_9AGAR|nr:heterokaryon incompatibility protein-domain-containing protein [Collybia nuda]